MLAKPFSGKPNKTALKWTWILFLPVAIGAILLVAYITYSEMENRKDTFFREELRYLSSEGNSFLELVEQSKKDLYFLSSLPEVVPLLQGNTALFDSVAQVMKIFGETRKVYDQVRLLDATGMEKLRINCFNQKAEILPLDLLQNKSHRYYVAESLQLRRDEIYISPFDLNIEEKKLEMPYNPTIRFLTPIYSPQEKLLGFQVLNCKGRAFLKRLERDERKRGNLRNSLLGMVDGRGNWLRGFSKDTDWGFLLPEELSMQVQNLASLYPDLWSKMQKGNPGFITCNKNFFSFMPIRISYGVFNSSFRTWYLLSAFPKKEFFSKGFFFRWGAVIICLLVILWTILFLSVCRFFAFKKRTFLNPLKGSEEISVWEILEEHEKKGHSGFASVALLNITNLSSIRQAYGQEFRTAVLHSVADVIRKELRSTDVAGKYEENRFLIYLPKTRMTEGDRVVRRILSRIEKNELISGESINLAIEYGIAEISEELPSLGEALKVANERMTS